MRRPGPRVSRTRSSRAVRVSPSVSVRRVTASRPSRRSSTLVARLSLVAPTSAARSATGSVGACRCCQTPESPTASAAVRSSRSSSPSEPSPMRAATSTSSRILPTDAVGMTTWSSTENSSDPVARSTARAETCTPASASSPRAWKPREKLCDGSVPRCFPARTWLWRARRPSRGGASPGIGDTGISSPAHPDGMRLVAVVPGSPARASSIGTAEPPAKRNGRVG